MAENFDNFRLRIANTFRVVGEQFFVPQKLNLVQIGRVHLYEIVVHCVVWPES